MTRQLKFFVAQVSMNLVVISSHQLGRTVLGIKKLGLRFLHIHVEDLAKILEASMQRRQLGQIYNIISYYSSLPFRLLILCIRLFDLTKVLSHTKRLSLPIWLVALVSLIKGLQTKNQIKKLGIKLQHPDYRLTLNA